MTQASSTARRTIPAGTMPFAALSAGLLAIKVSHAPFSRRVGFRSAPSGPPDAEPPELGFGEAAELPVRPPEDPARVAAAVLLRRALDAAGTDMDAASADGFVALVFVPSAAWTEVVRDEWRSWARGGERYQDGGNSRYYDGEGWAAWTAGEAPRASAEAASSEMFAQCVSRGRHCLGVAADPAWLPSDLVRAADHRLTLPTPTGADVAAVARELCGADAAEGFPARTNGRGILYA